MASIKPSIGSDDFLAAVSETLARETREFLKAPLMAIAEKQINEAVAAAVESMRPRIETYVQEYDMKTVINVILASKKAAEE